MKNLIVLMTTLLVVGACAGPGSQGPSAPPKTPIAATPANTAGSASGDVYNAHMKFVSTNGGYIACTEFDAQFRVSNANLALVQITNSSGTFPHAGSEVPINTDGTFQLHYTRPDGYAVNTITGRVEGGHIAGTFLSVGRSTTCTYSFSAVPAR